MLPPQQLRLQRPQPLKQRRRRNRRVWMVQTGNLRGVTDVPTCLPRRVDRLSFLDRNRRSSGCVGANLASVFQPGDQCVGLPRANGMKACSCLTGQSAGPGSRHCSGACHPDFHPEGGDGVGRGDGRTTCCLGCSFFSFSAVTWGGLADQVCAHTPTLQPQTTLSGANSVPLAHRCSPSTNDRRSRPFSGAAVRGATRCFPHRSRGAPTSQYRLNVPAIPTLLTGGSQPACRS